MAATTLLNITVPPKSVTTFAARRSLAQRSLASSGRGGLAPIRAQSNQSLDQQDIEGLDRSYCDDFICTSSPAVEATVRSFARDLIRANGVYTKSILSRNVEYKDTFRRFAGVDGYQRMNFVTKYMTGAEVTVTKMRMDGTDTAYVDWRLRGSVGPFPVDVDMTSTIKMNLLTGQIEKQEDSWNLKRCSPQASAAWNAARGAWAVSSAGAEAAESTSSLLESLTSVDEGDETNGMERDPNDPMRFFQQKDSFRDDGIAFVGFVLVLYIVVQAYTILFSTG